MDGGEAGIAVHDNETGGGMSEDRLCCQTVWSGWSRYGCAKKATVESNGKWYCGTHSPEAVERRKKRADELSKQKREAWEEKWARQKYNETAGDVCRRLGINDPHELLTNWQRTEAL